LAAVFRSFYCYSTKASFFIQGLYFATAPFCVLRKWINMKAVEGVITGMREEGKLDMTMV
jgi:hypothetical protein